MGTRARLSAVLIAVLISGCVHSSHFYMPDGSEGFIIRCGGRFNDMAACYNRAHEECQGPYRILSGANDQRVDYGLLGNQPTVVDHREITVVCDAPRGPPRTPQRTTDTADTDGRSQASSEEQYANELYSLTEASRQNTGGLRDAWAEMVSKQLPAQTLSAAQAHQVADALAKTLKSDAREMTDVHDRDGRVLAQWREKIPYPGPILQQAMETYFTSLLDFEKAWEEMVRGKTAYLDALRSRFAELESGTSR